MQTPASKTSSAGSEKSRAIAVTNKSKQGASFPAPHAAPGVSAYPSQLKKVALGKDADETTVEWKEGTLAGSDDCVGTGMLALNLHNGNVDSGELVGTPPKAAAQKDLMSNLPTKPSLKSTDKYIKGHLLNHNIGGPGEPFNLFPITASANSAHHSFVEKEVKNSVRKGNYVNYKVIVDSITDDSAKGNKSGSVNATFKCEAEQIADKDNNKFKDSKPISKDIVSEFQKKAEVRDLPYGGKYSFDKENFPANSWLGGIYDHVKDKTDASAVDNAIEHFATTTTAAFFDEHKKNKHNNDSSIVKLLVQTFNSKGKIFTDKQQHIIHNTIVDVTFAYVVSKDPVTQAEYEAECPLLVNILKSKPNF